MKKDSVSIYDIKKNKLIWGIEQCMSGLFPRKVFLGENYKLKFEDFNKDSIEEELYVVGCGNASFVVDYQNSETYTLSSLDLNTLEEILFFTNTLLESVQNS